MAVATTPATQYVDMYGLNLLFLNYGSITASSAAQVAIDLGTGFGELLKGSFTFGANGAFSGGTLTGFSEVYPNGMGFEASGFSFPILDFVNLVGAGDYVGILNAAFGGNDQITGSALQDYLNGMNGADTLLGLDGDDLIDGAAGDDSIQGGAGGDTVRGLEDNDTIDGGAGDDDVNGNMGVDLVHGGAGNDSVRGGQGNDVVYGDDGDDGHVNGNLGDDRVFGGAGNDTVYGGQGSDTLQGDDGNDWISGDLGNDSLFGGAGADRFLFRAGSGVDTVGDFNYAAGDRVQLAPGTAYTLSLSGANAVISLGVGDQIILVGTGAATADFVVFA
jgi:Ca2+-binding RTX toxin-like protein